jgi:Ran-interacting Mog1 protein
MSTRNTFCPINGRLFLFQNMLTGDPPTLSPRKLYGGAAKCLIPSLYMDASKLRQIPDSQEVFLDPSSDSSLILELLEPTDSDACVSACAAFAQLAADNDALEASIESTDVIDAETIIVRGTQTVSKFGKGPALTVKIVLGLIRLDQFNADVLMTLNDVYSLIPFETVVQILQSFTILDETLFK